jgi:crotonobetaine/carnitine-CoA ligase
MLIPLEVLQLYRKHNYTLADALASRREMRGAEPFIVFEGETTTWDEFHGESVAVARRFHELGVKAGDRVAIMARNSPAHVVTQFALARLGAIMVPINPQFGVQEARYVVDHADISGILFSEETRDRAREASAARADRMFQFTIDGAPAERLLTGPSPLQDPADALNASDPEAVCVIIYTSGTTGSPKGAMHSQRSYLLAGEAFVQRMRLQPDDRAMIVLPMFHMNALFYSVSGAVAAGASIAVMPRFSASTFWTSAIDAGATLVNMIESMGAILQARPRSEYRAGHKLRAAYGIRQGAAGTFRDEFNIHELYSGFGMTEVPGVTCNPHDRPNKPGSMGLIGNHPDPSIPWARCRVVDDEHRDVAVNEVGELIIKTPIVMKGYFRDEEQTKAAFRDGWFYSGDLVRRDEDGFYFYVSRKKDIIRRRGENIAGAELDRVIGSHPAVEAAAAIATPSELGEDEILAVVVTKSGAQVSAQDIADWCRKHLAPQKVPRFVTFVPSLPFTPTHKIAKEVLRRDASLRAQATDLAKAAATAN